MDRAVRRSLSVLVDNEAGVLSQVSRLFSRKGYNIESLAVGTTDDPAVSRITIEVLADDKQINLLSNQLRKLLPVHSVKLLHPENAIRRELLCKITNQTHLSTLTCRIYRHLFMWLILLNASDHQNSSPFFLFHIRHIFLCQKKRSPYIRVHLPREFFLRNFIPCLSHLHRCV